ncbi:hypothetical protein NEMIN01_2307 [Nematocida minor]|uniref:uncharacterized protein n=1 Tax=Nematocida minor TaxID=1912983 RepID=UPI002220BCD1|nr:uncharacterized protein NEMIN01_2307 [Nematocida minor]KAI5192947.1 hypothetical protein NEMIN01_2307 [Nematocida minor]
MIPIAVQARTLVVLGLEELEKDSQLSKLNGLAGEEQFDEENTKIDESVALSVFESAKIVNELVSKLDNMKINGKTIKAFSLSRYMAMYSLGKAAASQGQVPIKPAVKKIAGEKEIAVWKSEALGEQFLIYNEGTFSNYQLSKVFPCKLIKTKLIKDVSVRVENDLVIVQKQKNIFVYGGYLELLDGFVINDLISCYMAGDCIVIGDRPDPVTQVWSIHNVYTKSLIKTVEISKEEKFSVSKDLTHYLISHENTIEIKSMQTDENIFPEYSVREQNKKVEGLMSPHDNTVFVVKSTAISMEWILYCLTTGNIIRRKAFSNIESYAVTFAEQEVAIVNVRKIGGKCSHYMDIWNTDGNRVISKALGENIKAVYPSKYTTVVLGQSVCKVYKRLQYRLHDGVTVKDSISKVEAGEITVLLSSTHAYVIDREGELLNKIEIGGMADIQVSPFGLYIALLSEGQVRVLDICGKEVFASNIEKNNGFFWRTVVNAADGVSLGDEEIQKYKTEDSLRRKEARKQFMKENEEKIQEWRDFLSSMAEFRSLAMRN